MTSNSQHTDEMLLLVDSLREDELTDVQSERLAQLVGQHPETRRLYLQLMGLHVGLHWRFGVVSSLQTAERAVPVKEPTRRKLGSEINAPLTVPNFSDRRWHWRFTSDVLSSLSNAAGFMCNSSVVATLLIATIIYGTFGLSVWQMSQYSTRDKWNETAALSVPKTDKPVARYLGGVNCRWEGNERPLRNGSQMKSGMVRLAVGIAEFEFAEGASVVIEGPCVFDLVSANRGELERGKLVARVPRQAIGFRVDTPSGTITDLGTEFGVEVADNGDAAVEVFAGKVETSLKQEIDRSPSRPMQLVEGQAARLRRGATAVETVTSQPNRFVRSVAEPTNETRPHNNRVVRAAGQERILLSDDFSDGELDARKWSVVTNGIPQGAAEVRKESGVVRLINRGHLVTIAEFDPVRLGGLRITGRWQPVAISGGDQLGEYLRVLTRSDGVPGGAYGKTRNGLAFEAVVHPDRAEALTIAVEGTQAEIAELTTEGSLKFPGPQTQFDFVILDDGRNVSMRVTEVGRPENSASVAAVVVRDATQHKHVVFHNRERVLNVSPRESHLDNVKIELLNRAAAVPKKTVKTDPENPG